MTLIELFRFLRLKWKRIFIVALVCAVAFACGVKVVSVVKPSFTATSTVVATGGTFSAVSGLSQVAATEASSGKATVTSTSNTTNNTITFKGEGSSSTDVTSAVNEAAKQLVETAKSQEVVKNTSITEATFAQSVYKSSLFCFVVAFFVCAFLMFAYYIMRDSARGSIHSPEAVSGEGLRYLGTIEPDEVSVRMVVANFQFSNKDEGVASKRVLLHPTGSGVRAHVVGEVLMPIAKQEGVILKCAPSLQESTWTLYKSHEADTVIVVVEENISTLCEVEKIVREFNIANVPCGGFVFLPHSTKQIKSSKRRMASGTHGNHSN